MRKVILFGGSFDPVHKGHLEVARNALKATHSDEVWFVLAAHSPFKDGHSTFYDRKKMLELMIRPYKRFKICTIEEELPIPSYSIDTVKLLKKKNPNTEFLWLIGSDQIKDLNKWKDYNQLKKLVTFCVYERPGYNDAHEFISIPGTTYDVSSTDIREGRSYDTDPVVLRYMMSKGLYLETMTKNRLSEKRFKHTLRVTELALELAEVHYIDKDRVYLAAMTHDWCKEWDSDTLLIAMNASYPKYKHLHPAFYHGFAAAAVLSSVYNIKDKAVLQAIRSHVNGASTSKIGMILYIADKCERGRSYDSSELIELSKKDLNKGFKAVKRSSQEYIKENV